MNRPLTFFFPHMPGLTVVLFHDGFTKCALCVKLRMNVRIHRIYKVTKWLFHLSSSFHFMAENNGKNFRYCRVVEAECCGCLYKFHNLWLKYCLHIKSFQNQAFTTIPVFFLRFFFYFHSLFFGIQFLTKNVFLGS